MRGCMSIQLVVEMSGGIFLCSLARLGARGSGVNDE